jgi:hypothetical protein
MEQDGKKAAAESDDVAPSNMDAMAALFGFLVRNAIVSEYQVKKGVARLHKLLPDLSLVYRPPGVAGTLKDGQGRGMSPYEHQVVFYRLDPGRWSQGIGKG